MVPGPHLPVGTYLGGPTYLPRGPPTSQRTRSHQGSQARPGPQGHGTSQHQGPVQGVPLAHARQTRMDRFRMEMRTARLVQQAQPPRLEAQRPLIAFASKTTSAMAIHAKPARNTRFRLQAALQARIASVRRITTEALRVRRVPSK